MNKILLFILIILNISCSRKGAQFAEKRYFNFVEIKSLHKKIAILPVNYAYNQDSKSLVEKTFNKNDANAVSEQAAMGRKLQHTIYEEFAKKTGKLEILNDKETNLILAKNNIYYNDIRRLSKVELAKILDVDAVVYCDLFVGAIIENQTSFYKNMPITTQQKVQLIEFIVEIHGNIEDDVIWKAKTIIPMSYIYDVNYNTQFREMIQLDLIPIVPYYK